MSDNHVDTHVRVYHVTEMKNCGKCMLQIKILDLKKLDNLPLWACTQH